MRTYIFKFNILFKNLVPNLLLSKTVVAKIKNKQSKLFLGYQ